MPEAARARPKSGPAHKQAKHITSGGFIRTYTAMDASIATTSPRSSCHGDAIPLPCYPISHEKVVDELVGGMAAPVAAVLADGHVDGNRRPRSLVCVVGGGLHAFQLEQFLAPRQGQRVSFSLNART